MKDVTATGAVGEFLAALQPRVTGDLRADVYTRTLYSTDASLYQVMPHGVLIPRHADDIQAAVELAAKYRVPVLPRAGGSSLAGQAVNAALVIDTTRHLDQIFEINAEEGWVRVQPGVVLDTLNAALRPHGLHFGPDPASSNRACLGGIVSNNASGSHSILYGMTVDHVLEMNVILDDGSLAHFRPLDGEQLRWHAQQANREAAIYRQISNLVYAEHNRAAIRRGTPRHWRRCGGYNLARFIHDGTIDHYLPQDEGFNLVNLLAGAEGTLAAITELKLKVVPRPQRTALVIVEFPTLITSLRAVTAILETDPSAVELIDDLSLAMARTKPEYDRLLRSFVQGEPFCFLAVEYYGASEAELRSKTDDLMRRLSRSALTVGPMTPLLDAARQANVWSLRKVGLGLLMSLRGEWKPLPFIEDTAVPPEHLADYIPRIEAFCRELGVRMTYYAHASAGCLHIRPLINVKQAAELEKMRAITQFTAELLGEYGGALSSEHGDGRVRSWLNPAFYGRELYRLFKEVKAAFDPQNLFNPGNIVDAPAQDANLRIGPGYQTISLNTRLHFADGFATEVEMCNGAGVCRKLNSGAMCPSFMATRQEEHSTRGRANLLRAALAGWLPHAELTGPRMYAAMELCVSCKTCKAECPSSVDMARLKTEFLSQYYDKHSRPLRDHLFSHIDTLSKLAGGWRAPLANRVLSWDVTKSVLDRGFGISRERTLPRFARRSFAHEAGTSANRAAPPVVLFVDTYNAYSYPHVAQAAADVLTAAGYRVIIPNVTDAGRPALSKGMIELARAKATQVLAALERYARTGAPIIFLEPSDWSAVVDDYAALLPDDRRRDVVARHAFTFEQFIANAAAQGELRLHFDAAPRQVLLHGHCHQKALGGTAATVRMLSLPPGYRVTELDTSCCGMAGAFGYEAEHYDISLKMGELRLLPAVRAAAVDTLIVAAGVSCRQQIAHGAGRTALHPAEALRLALVDE